MVYVFFRAYVGGASTPKCCCLPEVWGPTALTAWGNEEVDR